MNVRGNPWVYWSDSNNYFTFKWLSLSLSAITLKYFTPYVHENIFIINKMVKHFCKLFTQKKWWQMNTTKKCDEILLGIKKKIE